PKISRGLRHAWPGQRPAAGRRGYGPGSSGASPPTLPRPRTETAPTSRRLLAGFAGPGRRDRTCPEADRPNADAPGGPSSRESAPENLDCLWTGGSSKSPIGISAVWAKFDRTGSENSRNLRSVAPKRYSVAHYEAGVSAWQGFIRQRRFFRP